jgi:hypothetical protein
MAGPILAGQQPRELQTCFSGSSHCLIPFFPPIFGGAEGFPPFISSSNGRPVREETKATRRKWLRKFHQTRLKNRIIIRKEETTEIRRVHHRHLLKKNTTDANHHNKEISRRSSTRDLIFHPSWPNFKRNFLDGDFLTLLLLSLVVFAGRAERE